MLQAYLPCSSYTPSESHVDVVRWLLYPTTLRRAYTYTQELATYEVVSPWFSDVKQERPSTWSMICTGLGVNNALFQELAYLVLSYKTAVRKVLRYCSQLVIPLSCLRPGTCWHCLYQCVQQQVNIRYARCFQPNNQHTCINTCVCTVGVHVQYSIAGSLTTCDMYRDT